MDKYQVLRPLTSEEYNELKESIRQAGVIYSPILIDEHGDIIDGYHRQRIYEELSAEGLNIKVTRNMVGNLPEEQKIQIAFELNAVRRQMTPEQIAEARTQVGRRQAAEQSLKQSPQMADNWHAKQLGISKNTVADTRKELEAGCQIDTLNKLIGIDGKQYPRQIERKPLLVSDVNSEQLSKAKTLIETAAPEFVNAAAEGKLPLREVTALSMIVSKEDQVEAYNKVISGKADDIMDGLDQARNERLKERGELEGNSFYEEDEEERRQTLIDNTHKAFHTICQKVYYLRDDYANIAWCLLAAGDVRNDLIEDLDACIESLQHIKAALSKNTSFLQAVK